ncbi:hypothetical protein ACUUL3_09370 [Thiovibrio sp. JS02]
MTHTLHFSKRLGWLATMLSILGMLGGCTYQDRVAPLNLPDANNGITLENGLKISALAFTDANRAKDSFGFDARAAGLLPVQVTFQNDSHERVMVNPTQTFLVDRNNKAWPILTLEKTYQRTSGQVDIGETAKGAAKPSLLMGAAGALAGLAVGVATGNNVGEAMGTGAVIGAAGGAMLGGAKSYATTGEKIKDDLAGKTLQNAPILPQQIAYGVLFFPGIKGEEADGVKELRLSITVGETPQVVKLAFPD